jgi:23S rRNA (adenine2503-C2)-methyltransferase
VTSAFLRQKDDMHLNPANPLLIDTPFTEWQFDGLPSYRVEQIREWIFEKGILTFKDMTNLPGGLRQELGQKYDLTPMETAREQGSADTTQKFLWKLRDEQFIESVLIPATEGTKGVRASRLTLCVSTQVGCALGCKFCASGLDGFNHRRNCGAGHFSKEQGWKTN